MDATAPLSPTSEDARDRSLQEDMQRLAEDARTLAEAELAYQKSRAAFAGQQAKGIAVFGLLAAVAGYFLLVAFTVGLIFALSGPITPWGAMGVVMALWLVLGLVCGLIAFSRWRRMSATLSEGKQRE
jgi:hypothetical protein